MTDSPSGQLKRVSDIIFERTYDIDESIFEEGQPGAAMFLILDGKVAIEICRETSTHPTGGS